MVGSRSSGPLAGVRVVELAGLGPAPFGAMVLADLGAEVVLVDRAAACVGSQPESVKFNALGRGRRSVGVDLKHPDGPEVVARLCENADVLVEGMRPGVAERLGVGPDVLCERNPALVYARMTGWGQDGPMAARAGHDINYIAVAGPLAHIGRAGQPPTVPLNLVGDFGGGGMLLALGVCAALVERATSGRGQVIDAAMVDGAALLLAPIFPAFETGYWHPERGTNALDGGAPFYDCYRCADGEWISVGAIEPQFYAALLEGLGLADAEVGDQNDESRWPATKERFAEVFATRTRAEWVAAFAGVDACVAPVLSMGEVAADEHLVARGTYVTRDGVTQAAPAPRFSRTPGALPRPPAPPGHHTVEVLGEAGWTADEIAALRGSGAVA
jgi:alpha-methylacyl-CoA racemase